MPVRQIGSASSQFESPSATVLKGRGFEPRRKCLKLTSGFRWDETAGLAERAMLLSATHSRCKKETSQ